MTEIPTKRTTKPSAKLRSTDNAWDMELTSHCVAHDRAIAAETSVLTPTATSAVPTPAKQKTKAPPATIPKPGTTSSTVNHNATAPTIDLDSDSDDTGVVGRAVKRRIMPESLPNLDQMEKQVSVEMFYIFKQMLTGCLCIFRCA